MPFRAGLEQYTAATAAGCRSIGRAGRAARFRAAARRFNGHGHAPPPLFCPYHARLLLQSQAHCHEDQVLLLRVQRAGQQRMWHKVWRGRHSHVQSPPAPAHGLHDQPTAGGGTRCGAWCAASTAT